MARLGLSGSSAILPCLFFLLFLYVKPTLAFGAGNIAETSKIEGQNWRHGDIEDVLLTLLMSRVNNKKFSKLDVKRVYFGNWLRDYSQAVDVGTVKHVSAEAIRILLWILGFMSFGFGTAEFEVTTQRLGCYRPEEHIDNPKDYADNADARQYDRRLRGPIDERRELSVDERNGLKNYIASEHLGITTSAGHVRNLLRQCIQLGRNSRRSNNSAEFYEALRLLGTATHCLEDYTAHSNYIELCLIEMGERNVFPHVGRRTQIRLNGARNEVYPIVTGTFGGVDFLHSVMGEVSDKATQSEIQELEGAIDGSQNKNNVSVVKELLNKLPSGLIGGDDNAGKVDQLQANATAAQMQHMTITPKEPEAFVQQLDEITRQIYPVLEFHDQIMKNITEAIEKIPVLPELIDQVQEQITIMVFSLIAPFILPIIRQVKAELATGSSEVINSSRDKQHIVFNDDNSSDPTHSMLSKDHFTNILNEPAGKTAAQILRWSIPQIVDCWDDERADAERTIERIINGVFHHPALRDQGDDGARDGRQGMFRIVEGWWREKSDREKDDFRDKLSREGVRNGRNHKEGLHDKGHGCGHPLKMPGSQGGSANPLGGIVGAITGGQQSGGFGGGGGGGGYGRPQDPTGISSGLGKAAGEAVGGGLLGNLVGGVIGGVGGSLLGSAFEGSNVKKDTYQQSGQNQDGSYTQSYTETAHRPSGNYGGNQQGDKYGQAEYKRTEYQGGGQREEYKRYEQDGRQGNTGYGFEQRIESRPTPGGGYERTEERTYERPGGQWESERRTEGVKKGGEYYSSETKHQGSSYGREDSDDGDDYEKKERKRREKEEKERRKREKKASGNYNSDDSDDDKKKYGRQGGGSGGYGGGRKDDSDDDRRGGGYGGRKKDDSDDEKKQKRRSGGYGSGGGRQEYGGNSGYGQQSQSSGYGQQSQSSGYGRQSESSGYGRQSESTGYGRESEQSGYGRQSESSYGGRQEYGSSGGGYSQQQSSYGGDSQEYGRSSGGYGGRQEESGYGRRDDDEGGRRQGGGYGRRDDDDDDNRRSGRQQQGYGGGGYGGGY